VRVVLDEVRDSDGTRLKRTKVFAELDRNFRTLRPLFDFDHEGDRYAEATFWLEPGTAQGVAQFSGHVELLIPSRDPASIVTARFSMARDPGVPIGRNPVPGRGNPPGSLNLDPIPGQAASERQEQLLNEAGVQFLLEQQMDPRKEGGLATPSGGGTMLGWQFTFWGLGFTVRDPHQKVALHVTEFLDPRGRRIESTLAGLGVFKADMSCGFSFFSNPPLGTVTKFYLLTEKSVVPVPFEFKDIVASKQ